MNINIKGRKIWLLGSDADLQLSLKRLGAKEADFVRFETVSQVLLRLEESIEQPGLMLIEPKAEADAILLLKMIINKIDLQHRTILLLENLHNSELRQLCAQSACEFILKPLSPLELATRVERALKSPIRNSRLTLELLQSLGGELTSTEVKLLFCFLSDESRSVTREGIMNMLWNGLNVHPRTFDVHLFNLRKKLLDRGLQIFSDRGGKWTLVNSKEKEKENEEEDEKECKL